MIKYPLLHVESMLLDEDGEYWFGTYGNGVFIYSPDKSDNGYSSVEHIKIDPSNPYGIDAPNITDLFEDSSGLIWFGTNSNGLYTYQKRTKGFISYHHNYFQ